MASHEGVPETTSSDSRSDKIRGRREGQEAARKLCSVCEVFHPLEKFYPDCRYPDSRKPVCRACIIQQQRKGSRRGAALPLRAPQLLPKDKRCSRCSKVLAAERFHLNRCSGDGLHNWCKHCVSDQQKVRRNRNRSAVLEQLQDKQKACTQCARRLPVTHFLQDRRTFDALHSVCVHCWEANRTLQAGAAPDAASPLKRKPLDQQAGHLAGRYAAGPEQSEDGEEEEEVDAEGEGGERWRVCALCNQPKDGASFCQRSPHRNRCRACCIAWSADECSPPHSSGDNEKEDAGPPQNYAKRHRTQLPAAAAATASRQLPAASPFALAASFAHTLQGSQALALLQLQQQSLKGGLPLPLRPLGSALHPAQPPSSFPTAFPPATLESARLLASAVSSAQMAAAVPSGKACRSCGQHRRAAEFGASVHTGDGLSAVCLNCDHSGVHKPVAVRQAPSGFQRPAATSAFSAFSGYQPTSARNSFNLERAASGGASIKQEGAGYQRMRREGATMSLAAPLHPIARPIIMPRSLSSPHPSNVASDAAPAPRLGDRLAAAAAAAGMQRQGSCSGSLRICADCGEAKLGSLFLGGGGACSSCLARRTLMQGVPPSQEAAVMGLSAGPGRLAGGPAGKREAAEPSPIMLLCLRARVHHVLLCCMLRVAAGIAC